MFPAAFDYRSPDSLDAVLEILGEYADEAKVLAGGMSLIPLLKLRFAEPALVVDLGRIPGLDGLREDDTGLHIGALVRHATLAAAPLLADSYPVMAAAAPQVADPLVRNRGTLAGSLAHADPAGDWGSVMIALDARVVIRGSEGEREVPVREFFTGPFTTALEPTEMIKEVVVPRPTGAVGGTYLKLERKVGDFATVGVAVQLEMSNGHINRAGIGLTAAGPNNVAATAAEQLLAGAQPDDEVFAAAADAAARAAEPQSDLRGSSEYKRDMIRVFVQRGLRHAHELAQAA